MHTIYFLKAEIFVLHNVQYTAVFFSYNVIILSNITINSCRDDYSCTEEIKIFKSDEQREQKTPFVLPQNY